MSQFVASVGPVIPEEVDVLPSAGIRLLANAVTVAVPPVYDTLFSLALNTILPASFLHIEFTCGVLHIGAIANVAINTRFRLNGTLISPGGGNTANMPRSQINPIDYSARLPIVAGTQTVDVEWAGFGLPLGNIITILAGTTPDLAHAQLVLSEQI